MQASRRERLPRERRSREPDQSDFDKSKRAQDAVVVIVGCVRGSRATRSKEREEEEEEEEEEENDDDEEEAEEDEKRKAWNKKKRKRESELAHLGAHGMRPLASLAKA